MNDIETLRERVRALEEKLQQVERGPVAYMDLVDRPLVPSLVEGLRAA